jgi:hypothetical protein
MKSDASLNGFLCCSYSLVRQVFVCLNESTPEIKALSLTPDDRVVMVGWLPHKTKWNLVSPK